MKITVRTRAKAGDVESEVRFDGTFDKVYPNDAIRLVQTMHALLSGEKLPPDSEAE